MGKDGAASRPVLLDRVFREVEPQPPPSTLCLDTQIQAIAGLLGPCFLCLS
jgi:hypothetical protein